MIARLASVVLVAAASGFLVAPAQAADRPLGPTWTAYERSIQDAAVATPAEVVDDLLVPTAADPRTQWKQFGGEDYLLVSVLGYRSLSSGAPDQPFTLTSDKWVSVPGELAAKCAQAGCEHLDLAHLDLRLKQILGLPPDADYTKVTRFWVRVADLFRPCTDPRVTSPSCPTQVPADAPTSVGGRDLPVFLWRQANDAWRLPSMLTRASAISCSADFTNARGGQCLGYPWTRLGYTYDWAPKAPSERGVTEFIAVRGATVYLESTGPQRAYFPFTRAPR